MPRTPVLVFLAAAAAVSCSDAARPREGLDLESIRLPSGFRIDVWADDVPGARSLAWSPGGIVYVGTRGEGKVYAVVDENGDGTADRVRTIASGLNSPNGVAWREGSLYVAEIGTVLRFDGIDGRAGDTGRRGDDTGSDGDDAAGRGGDPPPFTVVNDEFPEDGHHGWKYIAFGPDGWLYVPVGAPCNICDPPDPYASILRMKPDGSELEVFARGVRNTVGFDWHPETSELWFTDNGRDLLGDEIPPDELNHAPKPGLHFGYPYCHGRGIADPEFGAIRGCDETTPPARELGPHVAALGVEFYRGTMFPQEYRNQIFIAEHGSWNRSTPIGYRVTLVRLEGNRAVSYEPFAEGWLEGRKAWGRPVDLLTLPDGSLLVSDDRAGAIYRISYRAGRRERD